VYQGGVSIGFFTTTLQHGSQHAYQLI